VDQDKNQLGILDIRKALELANEQGLDLVEVSPNTDPPVCRFLLTCNCRKPILCPTQKKFFSKKHNFKRVRNNKGH